MAITYHPDVTVVSGTDWTLAGILYDAAGKPLDVTNCTLKWILMDTDGNSIVQSTVEIAKSDPLNGVIQISLSEADTALRPGRYTDALQVTEGTSTDVFWIGQILVSANPFNQASGIIEQPVPLPPSDSQPQGELFQLPPYWWFIR